jgi:Mg/Co/Ni transporter MgtE
MIRTTYPTDVIRRSLRAGAIARAERLFDKLAPSHVSSLVQDLTPLEARALFDILFRPDRADRTVRELEREDLSLLLVQVDDDRLVNALSWMTGARASRLMSLVPLARRKVLRRQLQARASQFANGVRPVSSIMRPVSIALPSELPVDEARERIELGSDGEPHPLVCIVGRDGLLLGVVDATRLLSAARTQALRELMDEGAVRVGSSTPVQDVARLMATRVLASLPVVDERGCPIGEVHARDLEALVARADEAPPAAPLRGWRRLLPWLTAGMVAAGSMGWALHLF